MSCSWNGARLRAPAAAPGARSGPHRRAAAVDLEPSLIAGKLPIKVALERLRPPGTRTLRDRRWAIRGSLGIPVAKRSPFFLTAPATLGEWVAADLVAEAPAVIHFPSMEEIHMARIKDSIFI